MKQMTATLIYSRRWLLTALLGLAVNACAVLPEAPAPQPATTKGTAQSEVDDHQAPLGVEQSGEGVVAGAATDDVRLPEVIVRGPRTVEPGKQPYPVPPTYPSGPGYSGGSGPAGGGGGAGSAEPRYVGSAEGEGEEGPADVGDRSVSVRYKFDNGTDIVIKIEYTHATHKVEKVSTTTTGLIYGTVFKPFGDGLATYNPATNSFNFIVEFQFEGGNTQTGPIESGPIYRIDGTWNPATNRYRMRMIRKP